MTKNNDRLFLITGATGNTGKPTVQLLLERGHPVRAFVHREDDRSRQLVAAGAEIVVGDLLDFHDVSSALRGVSGAYFCYPIAPGLLDVTVTFAQAAAEAGVQSVVNMSQISARREAVSNQARQHSPSACSTALRCSPRTCDRRSSPNGSAGGGVAGETRACSAFRSGTAVTLPSPGLIRRT